MTTDTEEQSATGVRRRLIFVAKLLISISLLAWLLTWIDVREIASVLTKIRPTPVALAAVAIVAAHILNCLRWKYCFMDDSERIPYRYLFFSYWTSMFVGLVLPSQYGGDVLRVKDAWNMVDPKSKAVASVVLSRLASALTTALFFVVVGLVSIQRLRQIGLAWLLWTCIAGGGVLGLLFLTRSIAKWPAWLARILDAAWGLLTKKTWSVRIFGLSVLSICLMTINSYLCAMAVGESIALTDMVFFVPLIAMVHFLPSIGGLGVREGAFVLFFQRIGVSPENAMAMALLGRAIQLTLSLAGGVLFPFRRELLSAAKASRQD